MSRASREAQRRQEVKKRNRRFVIGGVGALAAISSVLVGGNILSGNEDATPTTVQSKVDAQERQSHLPADIVRVIESSGITEEYKQELLSEDKYKELANRKVRGRNISISQIGEFGPSLSPEVIFKTYDVIAKFIDSNPAPFRTNFTKFEVNPNGTTHRSLLGIQTEVHLNPSGKDIHVLEVPATPERAPGTPDVFTVDAGNISATFLKHAPDSAKALVLASVEACQGLIEASLTDESFIDAGLNKKRVSNVAQEQTCNGLGVAYAVRVNGFTYEDYVSFMQDQPNATSVDREAAPIGFAGQIPYVSTAEAYQAIGNEIPQDFFQNLTFPQTK